MAKTLLRAVSVTVSYAIVALAAYVTLSLGLTAIGRKLADSPACHSETYEFFDCCGAMTIYVVIVGPALIAGAFLYVILRLRRVRFVRAFSEVSLLASLFLGMVLLISFDPNLRGWRLQFQQSLGSPLRWEPASRS